MFDERKYRELVFAKDCANGETVYIKAKPFNDLKEGDYIVYTNNDDVCFAEVQAACVAYEGSDDFDMFVKIANDEMVVDPYVAIGVCKPFEKGRENE